VGVEKGSGDIKARGGDPPVWKLVRVFATAGQWHAAKGVLARHGIDAQMGATTHSTGGYDLFVQSTEFVWARQLIEGADRAMGERPTGGFPVVSLGESENGAPTPDPNEPAMRAIPVDSSFLSSEQRAGYDTMIWVLWALLAIVLAIMLAVFIL
jgi:hypothetical protein